MRGSADSSPDLAWRDSILLSEGETGQHHHSSGVSTEWLLETRDADGLWDTGAMATRDFDVNGTPYHRVFGWPRDTRAKLLLDAGRVVRLAVTSDGEVAIFSVQSQRNSSTFGPYQVIIRTERKTGMRSGECTCEDYRGHASAEGSPVRHGKTRVGCDQISLRRGHFCKHMLAALQFK